MGMGSACSRIPGALSCRVLVLHTLLSPVWQSCLLAGAARIKDVVETKEDVVKSGKATLKVEEVIVDDSLDECGDEGEPAGMDHCLDVLCETSTRDRIQGHFDYDFSGTAKSEAECKQEYDRAFMECKDDQKSSVDCAYPTRGQVEYCLSQCTAAASQARTRCSDGDEFAVCKSQMEERARNLVSVIYQNALSITDSKGRTRKSRPNAARQCEEKPCTIAQALANNETTRDAPVHCHWDDSYICKGIVRACWPECLYDQMSSSDRTALS